MTAAPLPPAVNPGRSAARSSPGRERFPRGPEACTCWCSRCPSAPSRNGSRRNGSAVHAVREYRGPGEDIHGRVETQCEQSGWSGPSARRYLCFISHPPFGSPGGSTYGGGTRVHGRAHPGSDGRGQHSWCPYWSCLSGPSSAHAKLWHGERRAQGACVGQHRLRNRLHQQAVCDGSNHVF